MPKPSYPYAAYMKSDKMTTIHADSSVGITRQPDEEVSAEWVENYIDAVDFFESINGTETVRRRRGVIYVKSVNSDSTMTREVVFTPIKEAKPL